MRLSRLLPAGNISRALSISLITPPWGLPGCLLGKVWDQEHGSMTSRSYILRN